MVSSHVGELAENLLDDLRLDVGTQERLEIDLLAVLRADEHRVDAHRLVVDVLDRYLALAVGRRYGTSPALRTSESRRESRWAIAIGIGMSSSVSLQA